MAETNLAKLFSDGVSNIKTKRYGSLSVTRDNPMFTPSWWRPVYFISCEAQGIGFRCFSVSSFAATCRAAPLTRDTSGITSSPFAVYSPTRSPFQVGFLHAQV